MIIVEINQTLIWFLKVGRTLIPTNSFSRHWFFYQIQEEYAVGRQVIAESQLHGLNIVLEDEDRLLCEIYNFDDLAHHELGDEGHIMDELQEIYGFQILQIPKIERNHRKFDEFPFSSLERDSRAAPLVRQIHAQIGLSPDPRTVYLRHISGLPAEIPPDTQKLIIGESFLTDLRFLEGLPELTSLTLEYCVIEDWQGLSKKNDLAELVIECVEFTDSTLLAEMEHLKVLRLIQCGLTEINGLSRKPDLQVCEISKDYDIRSLDPLMESTKMLYLSLDEMGFKEIDFACWDSLILLEMHWLMLNKVKNLDRCLALKIIDHTDCSVEEDIFWDDLEWLIDEHGLLDVDRWGESDEHGVNFPFLV